MLPSISIRLFGGLWALSAYLLLLSLPTLTHANSVNVGAHGAVGIPSDALAILASQSDASSVDDRGRRSSLDASSIPRVNQDYIPKALESEQQERDEGSEGEGQDGGSPEGDLVSSTPLGTVRGRAGILTILITVVLTSAGLFQAYKHRSEVLTFLTSLRQRASRSSLSMFSFQSISISLRSDGLHLPFNVPTISLPSSLSLTPRRRHGARRIRRSKPKGGFRPHVSRLNAWASEDGLFDDVRDDHSSSSSNDADIEAGHEGIDALDLGADEDFMIGASQTYPPFSVANKNAIGSQRQATKASRWWTKPPRKGKSNSGVGNVLFSLDDGNDEVETDEGLPLAPTPHNYGLGGVRMYGSANSGGYGH